MKTCRKLLALLVLLMGVTTACVEEHNLEAPLDKSAITYEVVQDLKADPGGNTVILRNSTPGTISMWDYGTGRSNRATETVKFAFAGEYTIKFSAATAGGIVEMDPVTVTVTENNFAYVNDWLWTALSGGVGNEKTWKLDIDAKFFDGPLYFYGTDNGWGGECTVEEGGDCWNWNPEYKSNAWLMDAGDYGTMTFSLVDGPYVEVNHLKLPSRGTESGTYMLDAATKTLKITDATPLHDSNRDGCVAAWGEITLISLTENSMQFAVVRTSCEGPCLLVYNYVSQDYLDNLPPDEPEEPALDDGYMPTFAPGELLDILTGGPAAGRVWKLDGSGNPVDWTGYGRGWTTDAGSSYNWGWNEDWTAAAGNSWIRFDRFFGTNTYTLSQNGVVTTSTFTINESTNEITLGGTNTLITDGGKGSWMNPTTNVIKVVKGWSTDYKTKGIWFGTVYTASKDEWLVFHYILP